MPGIYLVSYYFQGDPTAGNETISVRVTFKWNTSRREFYFYVTGGTFILEPAVSNTMVIEVTSSNATLSFKNPLAIGHVTTLSGDNS